MLHHDTAGVSDAFVYVWWISYAEHERVRRTGGERTDERGSVFLFVCGPIPTCVVLVPGAPVVLLYIYTASM